MSDTNAATPVAYLTVEQLRELFAGLNTQAEKTPAAETRLIYGLSDLAKFLKCSRQTAAKLIKSGQISSIKTGHKYIFDRETVLHELGYAKKTV